MYFSSILSVAVLTATATAAAVPAELSARRDFCGSIWDEYLGEEKSGSILGGGECQDLNSEAWPPNDSTRYVMEIYERCTRCEFFSDSGCATSYSADNVNNVKNGYWHIYPLWSQVKSFKC